MKIESLKKTQREIALRMENLGKKTGITDESITNRIQDRRENISGRMYNTRCRHNSQGKYKKTQNCYLKHSRNPGHNKKTQPENGMYIKE